MSKLRLSRRAKKQLRFAAQGILIGLTGSLMILCAMKVILRYSDEHRIGYIATSGLVLFAALFAVFVYFFMFATSRSSRRFPPRSYRPLAEFAQRQGTDDETKSA
jgi:TRAP-type C4-dicarboxylate transport system permease small subunit